MDKDIPQFLTDAYKREVEATLYSYHVLATNWGHYTPRELTRKEKIQRKIAHKKWVLGRYLSNKANELGYYDESY